MSMSLLGRGRDSCGEGGGGSLMPQHLVYLVIKAHHLISVDANQKATGKGFQYTSNIFPFFI